MLIPSLWYKFPSPTHRVGIFHPSLAQKVFCQVELRCKQPSAVEQLAIAGFGLRIVKRSGVFAALLKSPSESQLLV